MEGKLPTDFAIIANERRSEELHEYLGVERFVHILKLHKVLITKERMTGNPRLKDLEAHMQLSVTYKLNVPFLHDMPRLTEEELGMPDARDYSLSREID